MFKVLLLIDSDYVDYSIDLIEVASRLKESEKMHVYGLGINIDSQQIRAVDTFININIPTEVYVKDSDFITNIVEKLYLKYDFDCILTLASDFGRMLAPRIASRLRVGIVADVTSVKIERGNKLLTRPAYSGNMMASIICDSSPIMMTIRPGVFNCELMDSNFETIQVNDFQKKAQTVEVVEVVEKVLNDDIAKADIIISAGAGYNGTNEELAEVAKMLNASIGASKNRVDSGEVSRDVQIGQSGKTVSPKLYIALGISGAIHHISGLKNVTDIVSINTDSKAPLNYLADVRVTGDCREFINKFKIRLENEQQ